MPWLPAITTMPNQMASNTRARAEVRLRGDQQHRNAYMDKRFQQCRPLGNGLAPVREKQRQCADENYFRELGGLNLHRAEWNPAGRSVRRMADETDDQQQQQVQRDTEYRAYRFSRTS